MILLPDPPTEDEVECYESRLEHDFLPGDNVLGQFQLHEKYKNYQQFHNQHYALANIYK